MSYILDALKKSDQQRRQGAAPSLTMVNIQGEDSQRRQSLSLGLFALVLLLLGVLIGWWRPWANGPTAPAPLAAAPQVAAAPPEASPVAALPRFEPPPSPSLPAVRPPLPTQAKVAALPAPAPARQTVAATAQPPLPAQKPAATPEPASLPAPKIQAAEPVETKTMARSELPASIQQEIPKLVVALHAYSSKPKSRLVSVNDQLLHEGEALAPGLVLEQITQDGMVFSYKGYRFRHATQ